MPKSFSNKVRSLIIVLGDQLNEDSAAFDGFDKDFDIVCMAEVKSESNHVWSHKARIAVFLSGMRHFAHRLEEKKYHVVYQTLDDPHALSSFKDVFGTWIKKYQPQKVIVVEPGEYRVLTELASLTKSLAVDLEVKQDRSFLSSVDDFKNYAKDKKQIRMEFFYREMRRRHNILMDEKDPIGGKWNFDQENRKSFGKQGPGKLPELIFNQDKTTKDVISLVNKLFKDHPGSLENFNWTVTPEEAQKCLDFFIKNLLPEFGNWQDAMWEGEAFLYHSRLSVAMNLKLISPLKVIKAAEKAYHQGKASLPAVEGFIRQILGWREYVRGVYFSLMPGYLERNFLNAYEKLPPLYWSGKTEMNCLKTVINQTMDYGYAHHIQRLMITGLFSLLYGVNPKEIHEWYLAVYVDAIEWVELPNTLGMSQYADGGVMASKPYIASGKYVSRMSNYCKGCRFDPGISHGEKACPFTTLYWDFVRKHKNLLEKNPRLGMQVKNWNKFSPEDQKEIMKQAKLVKELCHKEKL
jgi:deoxyribodipyrimidine photolyase-related protein